MTHEQRMETRNQRSDYPEPQALDIFAGKISQRDPVIHRSDSFGQRAKIVTRLLKRNILYFAEGDCFRWVEEKL